MAAYLVTGAAGFIASRVCEMLLDEGHAVAGLDLPPAASDRRLKEWRLQRLTGRAGFRYHTRDVRDRAGLAELWAQAGPFDGVVHLAGLGGVRQSVADPWTYLETNTAGTLNLLDLCRARGTAKLVLASSSSVYGAAAASGAGPCREDADTSRPLSPYAASKKAAELLCATYHALHGLDVTVFRYFTVYGPAGRPGMAMFNFVQRISEGRPVVVYGDGSQQRDFSYIDDIARGTVAGLRPLGCETINLGSDRPVPLLDVLRAIEQLTGRQARLEFQPAHPADAPVTWAEITRARTLLGWEPRVDHREGLARLLRWYQENREWAREIPT
jgi:nucleoside-diphosphate-sugar epimerase